MRAERLGLLREFVSRGQQLPGGLTGFARGLTNAADVPRNLVGTPRSLLDITRDLARGHALFFNSRSDGRGDLIY